jgi:hypothetical protein
MTSIFAREMDESNRLSLMDGSAMIINQWKSTIDKFLDWSRFTQFALVINISALQIWFSTIESFAVCIARSFARLLRRPIAELNCHEQMRMSNHKRPEMQNLTVRSCNAWGTVTTQG